MFENMSEFVGYAMHDDLLLRARKDARVTEAQRGLQRQRRSKPPSWYRRTLARALVSVADWLAPSVTAEQVTVP
jgi:hypothetical protein